MIKNTAKFIKSIFPSGFIPLHSPCFEGSEKKYVSDTIDSTFVSSVGEYVNRFEKDLANFTGHKFAIATVNGTAALHMAMILSGVKDGDEVITQSTTFVATCNAIRYANASPIFVDVDRDSLSLSPDKLSDWLDNNAEMTGEHCFNSKTKKRIKACVPMHTFGLPGRLREIGRICESKNIQLIDDSAEALGSRTDSEHVGHCGKISIFSFNGNKIITTGGGGAIVTNDEKIALRAKHLTTTAKVPHPWFYEHDEIGFNYRMPNINAALGVAQLEKLEEFVTKKRALAACYSEFFSKLGVKFVSERNETKSNYWLNAVEFKNKTERDRFLTYTNENGVMTRPIWNSMHSLKIFENCQMGNLENSLWLEQRVVNIPSSVNCLI